MVDDRLDSGGVEDTILVTPLQVGYGRRSGNFMTHYNIEIEDFCPLKRFVTQMRLKNLFRNRFAHLLLQRIFRHSGNPGVAVIRTIRL